MFQHALTLDLVQQFVSVIGEDGYRIHMETGVVMDRIRAEAFEQIAIAIRTGNGATEYDVQQFIMRRFAEHNLTTYSPPMVGVNDHPADPHFEVTAGNAREFKPGVTLAQRQEPSRQPPRSPPSSAARST